VAASLKSRKTFSTISRPSAFQGYRQGEDIVEKNGRNVRLLAFPNDYVVNRSGPAVFSCWRIAALRELCASVIFEVASQGLRRPICPALLGKNKERAASEIRVGTVPGGESQRVKHSRGGESASLFRSGLAHCRLRPADFSPRFHFMREVALAPGREHSGAGRQCFPTPPSGRGRGASGFIGAQKVS